MQIIIHRGTHQIGGCATEIRSGSTRILIDLGEELNGGSELKINGVTNGTADCDGVLFTHYHGDHIGLVNAVLHQFSGIIVDVHLHLSQILMSKIAYLQINQYKAFEDIVVKYKIDIKIASVKADFLLT